MSESSAKTIGVEFATIFLKRKYFSPMLDPKRQDELSSHFIRSKGPSVSVSSEDQSMIISLNTIDDTCQIKIKRVIDKKKKNFFIKYNITFIKFRVYILYLITINRSRRVVV